MRVRKITMPVYFSIAILYLEMMEGNAGKEDVKDGRKQTGTDTAAD